MESFLSVGELCGVRLRPGKDSPRDLLGVYLLLTRVVNPVRSLKTLLLLFMALIHCVTNELPNKSLET